MQKTPFDIPELRSLIISHFSRKDFGACVLVCKAWHHYFQPQVWSSVSTPYAGLVENIGDQDAWQESVQKHVRWARHVFGDEHSGVLCKLAAIMLKHCRDLVSMHISMHAKADISLWIQLIKVNLDLQVIKFPTISRPASVEELSQLVEALKGHDRLRCLELECTMPLPFLYQLLGSCPSLQELSVIDVVDGTDEQQNAQAEERPPSVKVTRTFALRRLNVFGYRAHPAVAELLSHTPTLESLGLGDISPACRDSLARVIHERKLPMLSDLTLKPLGALETLTRAIPPQQLRSITINSSGTAPMGYLLSVHGQFLERIRFTHFPGSSALISVFLQCPRLKELVVERNSSSEYLELRKLLYRPWVCIDLEILSVPIGVERWLSARLPPVLIEAMAENDTQPTYRPQWKLAEALFMDRFRQLKKLRVVDFGNVPSYCALSYAAQMEAGTKTLTLPDQGPDDEYDLESGDEDYWTSENQVNILRRAPPRNSAQV